MSDYVVVDSSVSLKWALDDEEAVAEAVALRDNAISGQFQMVAPSLWLYEVTNGLVTATRRQRITRDLGAQALSHITSLGLQLADPEAVDVYEQALRTGRVVVLVQTPDEHDADIVRASFEASGAESVDAARDAWWIGLREDSACPTTSPSSACSAAPSSWPRSPLSG